MRRIEAQPLNECNLIPRHKFDYILVETTGLADPGPVAAAFWLDEELESQVLVYLLIY